MTKNQLVVANPFRSKPPVKITIAAELIVASNYYFSIPMKNPTWNAMRIPEIARHQNVKSINQNFFVSNIFLVSLTIQRRCCLESIY